MNANKHRVLVCDVGGIPHHWATWDAGIVLKHKNLISYELGDSTVYTGGVNRISGNRTQIGVGQILFLKESLKYDSRIPPLTNQNLFARDAFTCLYCGRFYHESKLSRDHIVPVSRGGLNTWKNCATSCKACNHAKDDSLLEELDWKLLAIPYTPNHAERLIMQNKKILFDQMKFLRHLLPENSRFR